MLYIFFTCFGIPTKKLVIKPKQIFIQTKYLRAHIRFVFISALNNLQIKQNKYQELYASKCKIFRKQGKLLVFNKVTAKVRLLINLTSYIIQIFKHLLLQCTL